MIFIKYNVTNSLVLPVQYQTHLVASGKIINKAYILYYLHINNYMAFDLYGLCTLMCNIMEHIAFINASY